MRSQVVSSWLVLALSLAACSGAGGGDAVDRAGHPGTAGTADVAVAAAVAPEPLPVLSDPDRTLVVRAAGHRFRVYEHPTPHAPLASRTFAANPWGQPLALPVTEARDDAAGTRWYEVRLPVLPNGSTGWVRAEDVTSSWVRQRIVVDLSQHHLWRYRRGELRTSLEVAVGAPASPTTTGRFFAWAQVDYTNAHGPYGVFALGLSGFSEALPDWPGGGRLAIHGTDDPADIGMDVSHGCVRVLNDRLTALRNVPLGTPVLIRS